MPRIYWDYGKTLTLWTQRESKHEGGAELLLFEKFQLVAEAGRGEYWPTDAYQNIIYHSFGTYYRLGGGYLATIDPQNKIGLGFRIGSSAFSEEGTITIPSASKLNPTYTDSYVHTALSARWYEIVLNSEKSITLQADNPDSYLNRMLSLGFMLRIRIMDSYTATTPIDVYAIPGFGRSVNSPFPALNFFVKVNL